MKFRRHSPSKPSTYIMECADLTTHPEKLSRITWTPDDLVYVRGGVGDTLYQFQRIVTDARYEWKEIRLPSRWWFDNRADFRNYWGLDDGDLNLEKQPWEVFLEIVDDLTEGFHWSSVPITQHIGYYVGKRPGLSRTRATVRLLKLTDDDWSMIDLEFELRGLEPYRPIQDKYTKAPTGH